MQLHRTLVVVLLLAVISAPAAADIYVWRDNAGVNHYVNDLENVPPEYRKEAIPVAKDWARVAPAAAPAEPSPTPIAAKPETGQSSSARDVLEETYEAGFRAGEQGSPSPPSSTVVGPIVQNFVVEPEPQIVSDRLIPLPFFVERRHPHARRADRNRDDISRRFSPASRAPFLQGPAGPPPLGAAGPPPVRFDR
jgi:hypothetical protein